MINQHYRNSALDTYGEACEICGHKASLEVHHIDYQEQWTWEKKVREAFRKKSPSFQSIMNQAIQHGYLVFDQNQLAKNDCTSNLSVLCGNCHGLMHKLDVGKKILRVLKERIKSNGDNEN